MSTNGSGTSIITPPSGGGSVTGMGEKFSPDLFTGTGNFSVPIAVPPGRNGFQPDITLVYSSGYGSGVFGLGWGLSIPGVSRKTSKGIPLYDDEKDVFVLSGAEDLVEVRREGLATGGYKAVFQPRTEGLFARIERYKDASNDYWKVWSKDGLVSYYGTPGKANTVADYRDPAVCADPDYRTKVFQWYLCKTEDVFGNVIQYTYLRENRSPNASPDDPHRYDQVYLDKVEYMDYTEDQIQKFLCRIQFRYQKRPDPVSGYKQGFEVRTTQRASRIELFSQVDGVDVKVKTYHFNYVDERVAAGELPVSLLPLNGGSMLSQVRIEGHDGEKSEWMPPLEFGYSGFDPQHRNFDPIQGDELPPVSLADPDYELADVFGNGLPDLVQLSGTVARYWKNLGNGRFDLPRLMKETPVGALLADPQVQLMDANGDGKLDLLVQKPGLNGYFSLQHDGLWSRNVFKRHRYVPSFSLADPEVKLLDLDGDGVTDVLRNGSRMECFFNDPEEGFYKSVTVEKRLLQGFPNVSFADPRVRTADMSGDGMQDLVLIHDGNVTYWPNMGHGRWGAAVRMGRSPRFPYRFNPAQVYLGDVDGDGCADLVYVEHHQVTLWVNQCGGGWSEPVVITGTPPLLNPAALRLADVKGTGIAGLLWSYDFSFTGRRERMFLLDFSQGVKPYVLNEMNNHMGAITRVAYRSSTEYYIQDQERRPADGFGRTLGVLPSGRRTPWKTTLPFPVQVVAKVEVVDELSQGKLVTEYSYHHGYWDGGEREFRGFGRVHQRDTESFERYNAAQRVAFEKVEQVYYSAPTETVHWFHLGPVGDQRGDWQEVFFEDEYWAEDPQVLQRPEEMWAMLRGLPRRARRDAYRALRGSTLRTELYAHDDKPEQRRPYTVSESLQGVRYEGQYKASTAGAVSEMPYGPEENNKQGSGYIFFAMALAARTSQWERGNEPMVSFSCSDRYDRYGNPQRQVATAIPRGRRYQSAVVSAEAFLTTLSVSVFAHRDEADRYLVGRPVRVQAFEVLNDGRSSLWEHWAQVEEGTASLALLGEQLSFYDGPAFTGLPYGQLGLYGIAVRSEALVFDESMLDTLYDAQRPPYLRASGSPVWTSEYPTAFRSALPPNAGYHYYDGSDGVHREGYYATANQTKFDFHEHPSSARGLMLQSKDPLGHTTTVAYDVYQLFPTSVTDALGMQTSAVYDYRVLQAREVTDPNGNRTQFVFSPLGFLYKSLVLGKSSESLGDTVEKPGTLMEYDFFAFYERRQPVWVKTTVREQHASQLVNDRTIVSIQYSDGFGRLLQTRTQAEETTFDDIGLSYDGANDGEATGRVNLDADVLNVVVSGWQVYDNKGQVVEKFEPFFEKGFGFVRPDQALFGQRVRMFYDPRGQVVRTVNPDNTEQRVVFGIPQKLSTPDRYVPTPWESYSYDANDLQGLTHPGDHTVPMGHWYTPSSSLMDALGRTVCTVDRNFKDEAVEEITMHYRYDIRGNLLQVLDPYGRTVFVHEYDYANRPLKTSHLDGGTKYVVPDVLDRPVELRDAKGGLVLNGYDELGRPTGSWARDKATQVTTLRQRLLYGDSAGLPTPEVFNLKGKLYKHYDEAGLTSIHAYDFKGQVPEKIRRVIKDSELLSVFEGPPVDWNVEAYRVDWETATDSVLDTTEYTTSMSYDALGRVTKMVYPEDVSNQRKVLLPSYNRSGALESVQLKESEFGSPITYVDRIAYNARGQKILTALGNGTMTRFLYREDNFRLLRMKSERYEKIVDGNTVTYEHQSGTTKQNFTYNYDLAGNIISISDTSTGCGVAGTDTLVRAFEYDALYRLLSATGRETAGTAVNPWKDRYRPNDNTVSRAYTQFYGYDKLGNIQELQHVASGGNFTRAFRYESEHNKLQRIDIGANEYGFAHDVNGNIIQEDTNRHFAYDYADRLKAFYIQANTEEPSTYTQYFYDASGNRVKKISRTQGSSSTQTTVYIDGVFEHTVANSSETIPNLEIGSWKIGYGSGEQNVLHIMDDASRIATLRIGDAMGDTTPPIKFNLEDHLGSSNLSLDINSSLVSKEEYYPFGETSFGSYGKKRYRFCGKEKDEESGLYAMGVRMYSTWTCRFTSVDKMTGKHPNKTSYHYASNNPINRIDPSGMEDEPSYGGERGNDNIAKGTYTHESGEEYNYTGEEGVSESTLKDFGWSKKIDVSNVSDKYVAQADNTRVEKPQFNPKDIKPSNKESPKLNSAEQALRDETVTAATEKGSQHLEKKAETIQKDLRKEGLVGSSNGKNYQTTLKKDGTPRELGNKYFRTTGHMPNTPTTKTLKFVAKGLSEIGNVIELANIAEVLLSKAEPYTLLPLSFVNDEIFANIDQALLSAALSQGYEAILNYKDNNEKLMKDFSMLYMNEADFNSLMSGEITELSQIKSLGDMSHGFAAFAHRGKSLSVLAGFKFK